MSAYGLAGGRPATRTKPRPPAKALFAAAAALLLCPFAHAQQASEPLADAAAAYAAYQADIGWLANARIDAPAALHEALDRAARNEGRALSQGWIASAALIAAQSPAFVRGVRARVRAAGRAAVLRRLNADVTYARLRPAGSAEATQIVLQSAAADGARASAAADRFLSLGDTLRTAPWAASVQTNGDLREARLHALAPAPLARIAPELRARMMDRVLTLAALRIVEATGAQRARVGALLAEDKASACFAMAQLEFRQCVSVTQFGYENAFCLARHGVREPGACLASLVAP